MNYKQAYPPKEGRPEIRLEKIMTHAADCLLNKKDLKKKYPKKFIPEERIFSRIRRGDRIFIGTGCGEPQYLLRALMNYVEAHPKALFDTEFLQVWTLGTSPAMDETVKKYFRSNYFFVADKSRDAVNKGLADYTPVFSSEIPDLFERGIIPIDVALIQTSPPDAEGQLGLGVNVDIVKAVIEKASLVIAQMNSRMPRVPGDGFIPIEEVNFIISHDEPLLEYEAEADNEIAQGIGKYVSRLVQDGDTIQIGYGSLPNAILSHLGQKQHLGVHTEFLGDGMIALMKKGVVDNTQKNINRGKAVATFCMGKKETYDYLDNNPAVELRTIDYTNNPMVIAQHRNMVAINTALEIDLTGQATAESIGKIFYSGIGGQVDFMRGAILSPNGRSILTIPSTAENGTVSRIVPFLKEGAGVTLNRGDVHYVVTEYGIAYLQGKNIRERAMELISIAHPQFQPWLVEEAKKSNLIFPDQAFIPGEKGRYPHGLERLRTTRKGLRIVLRPMKISDEPKMKKLFYSLSEESIYRRFHAGRKEMPHQLLQKFVVIDYTRQMAILAVIRRGEKEEIVGVGRYTQDPDAHTAEVALTVRDDHQNKGVGKELFSYLIYLAKKQGLLGFTANIQMDNRPMLRLSEKMGMSIEKTGEAGLYELNMRFRKK